MENSDLLVGGGGLVLLAFYFLRYIRYKDYQKNGLPADGEVTDLSLEYNQRQERYYYPIIRFALRDGTWVTAKYSDGSYPASFKNGESVKLFYKEENPESFIIVNNKQRHTDKIFLIIGTLMLAYSFYHLIK